MRIGGRILGGWLVACALLVSACGDDDGEAAPRATVPSSTSTSSTSSTTTTTEAAPAFEPLLADPSLTPEEQVEQAYLFSWEIYLDAVDRGDPSFLHLAHGDRALELVRKEVDGLVAEGHRVEGDVEHGYSVTLVEEDEAIVLDAYVNHLVLHDASSGEPLEADPNSLREQFFTLRRIEGAWLVVDIFGGS